MNSNIDPTKVTSMIQACRIGNLHLIHELLRQSSGYATEPDTTTGQTPLMAAAAVGNGGLCQLLLETGAPWNALDRQGKCAGDYATQQEQWNVVNLLVEWGTRAELILGAMERTKRNQSRDIDVNVSENYKDNSNAPVEHGLGDPDNMQGPKRPVEQEPCTKPDYLRQPLRYTEDGKALLDADQDAVMMEWERPLMQAHAQILLDQAPRKRILNIGFGMGIIDTVFQSLEPELHIIVEAHPDVYQRMLQDGWDTKPNVRICFGRWQDCLPKLIEQGVEVDGIFYDTYGEHFLDFEDFHELMVQMLSKPHGRYSFFNGLAPDNLFFHGVACQCVKLQLGQLGLDCEFLSCEIQVEDRVWEGIRRKYWHGRDTYYLPMVTWNAAYLEGSNANYTVNSEPRTTKQPADADMDMDGKRHRVA